MGKKRKMIAYPQKFGRKFEAHPTAAGVSNQQKIAELDAATQEVPAPAPQVVDSDLASTPDAPAPKKSAAPKKPTTPKKTVATKSAKTKAKAKKTSSKK